jgi:hypothetical protein
MFGRLFFFFFFFLFFSVFFCFFFCFSHFFKYYSSPKISNPEQLIDPVGWAAPLCGAQWGKFSNGTAPLLVWEPSDASTISLVLGSIAACPHRTPGGTVRFAINTDPLFFRTLAAAGVASSGGALVFESGAEAAHLASAAHVASAAVGATVAAPDVAEATPAPTVVVAVAGVIHEIFALDGQFVMVPLDGGFGGRQSAPLAEQQQPVPIGLKVPANPYYKLLAAPAGRSAIVCVSDEGPAGAREQCVLAGVAEITLGGGVSSGLSVVATPTNGYV